MVSAARPSSSMTASAAAVICSGVSERGLGMRVDSVRHTLSFCKRTRYAYKEANMISTRELTDVQGKPVAIPQHDALVHLQFRRFAGCPVCNLHLRSFVQRHAELEAAGIREVVVFHSPVEELQGYDLPFTIIPDPAKRLYREFGVEASPR